MEKGLTTAERKESEICRAISALEKSIDTLDKVSDELIGRIDNILRPPEPQTESCAPKENQSNVCHLANTIDRCTSRILTIRDMFEYTVSRVQL